MEIKKVLSRIYEFNLSKCTLEDGAEILSNNVDDELSRLLRKVDTNAGLIVQPNGYRRGLFYLKRTQELLNNPKFQPAIVKFGLEIMGLKKGSYYRLKVIARNYQQYMRILDITDDRFLHVVTSNNDMLINADLSSVMEPTEFSGIFKAYGNECVLHCKFGKLAIKNIILEEVELFSESLDENGDDVVVDGNRTQVVATAVFSLKAESAPSYQGKWIPLLRLYGKGLNLYWNKTTKEYVLERDNTEDCIGDNLNANHLMVSLNINKIPNIGFTNYRIKRASSELSPNTLKSGFIVFDFPNIKGEPLTPDNGKVSFKVERLI